MKIENDIVSVTCNLCNKNTNSLIFTEECGVLTSCCGAGFKYLDRNDNDMKYHNNGVIYQVEPDWRIEE